MIDKKIAFDLPLPWKGKKFQIDRIGAVNFLVGPNGSGKSQFARTLKEHLPGVRILSTDRLKGMERDYWNFLGDHFTAGLQKGVFSQVREHGNRIGSGLDALILLEERLELKIKVEATLSHLFDRRIFLEWESGNLVPWASLGSLGTRYRLDKDECHGIKELLVLLTHLYNLDTKYLIIDEPELHLHPQYQAFFIHEVRKIAGDPLVQPEKKTVFLITHSPFILDLQSFDDVQSIISFDLTHSVPKTISTLDAKTAERMATLTPRLNVEHRQLFFADNPVFVEGAFDAQIIHAVQNSRNMAIAAAGSCVITSGGSDEVNKFVELTRAFGKKALFLYDLDSLFLGTLRSCVKNDGTISDFLAAFGLGGNFSKYCGQLDKALNEAIGLIRKTTTLPLEPLRNYLLELLDGKAVLTDKQQKRARVALLTQLGRDRASIVEVITEPTVAVLEGYLNQIVIALRASNIFLLPRGALEHYLPSFSGDVFRMSDDAKRAAIEAETSLISSGMSDADLKVRYGALFDAISMFPAKSPPDVDKVIIEYLSSYIHDLQGVIVANPTWELTDIATYVENAKTPAGSLFQLEKFNRLKAGKFEATVLIPAKVTGKDLRIQVSDQTNAGMRSIQLRPDANVSDAE